MATSRARVLLAVTLLAVLLIALLVVREVGELRVLDEVGSPAEPPVATDDPGARPPAGVPTEAQRARVDRVVDGDTIRVAVDPDAPGDIPPTDSVPVRLLTIDTPETVHPQRDVECGGPEASARAEELLPVGSTVWLGRDVSDTDRFDRYLRVVWTADGTNVNATLVAEGLAEAVRFPPDERWYDEFVALEEEARATGRGNWTRCAA